MSLRNVHIPFHIRVLNSLEELKKAVEECIEKLNGKMPFFCFDPILYKDEKLDRFRADIEKIRSKYGKIVIENSYLETAQKVQREALEIRSDIIVAIGGGKCLDVAKYAGAQLGLPFIAIPTQSAHDGICSPIAVLEMKGITYSLPARSPEAVLIDLQTIIRSPRRALCAGIGDLLSNLISVKDWKLAERKQGEKFDDFAALLAYIGPENLIDSANPDLSNPEFIEKLLKGLILSGIAMELVGNSRPCSGSEHQISHAMDQLFPGRDVLHGEQVAFGTLVSSILWDFQPEFMREFLQKFNLPTRLSMLGFKRGDFFKIVDKAPQTRPGRYTILSETSFSNKEVIQKIEEFGILS